MVETKAFYKTTEFWAHFAFQLLLWVGALPVENAPHWFKTAASGAGVLSYGLSRGLAKGGSTFLPPKEVSNTDPLPEIPTAEEPPPDEGDAGVPSVSERTDPPNSIRDTLANMTPAEREELRRLLGGGQ